MLFLPFQSCSNPLDLSISLIACFYIFYLIFQIHLLKLMIGFCIDSPKHFYLSSVYVYIDYVKELFPSKGMTYVLHHYHNLRYSEDFAACINLCLDLLKVAAQANSLLKLLVSHLRGCV